MGRRFFCLNKDSAAVVDFVLDDLRRPAKESLLLFFEKFVAVFYGDEFISFGFSGSRKGKAAFLGFVFTGFFDYLRIIHGGIFSAVIKNDDAFFNTYHICRHADAVKAVCHKGFEKIDRGLHIVFGGGFGFLCKEERVMDYGFYHCLFSFFRDFGFYYTANIFFGNKKGGRFSSADFLCLVFGDAGNTLHISDRKGEDKTAAFGFDSDMLDD